MASPHRCPPGRPPSIAEGGAADSTISDNDADSGRGGGILLIDGSLTAVNTTISGNRADGPGGGLAVREFAETTTATLADYGGPTETHRPYHGSPAVGGGNPAGCTDALGAPLTTDQRGFPRPDGGRCDIAAVERVVCPCFGPDGPAGIYCYDNHYPSLNAFVYSPGRFDQVTPRWCRSNGLYRWLTPLQAERRDGDPHVRCH